MGDEEHLNTTAKNVGKTGEGFVKGGKAFHAFQGKNLKVKFQNSGKFTVFDKVGTAGKAEPIFRFDKPHVGAEFNHINMNPKYSGLPTDPHVKLPPGAMAVGNGTAKFCQAMESANKVLIPVAIAIDTGRVGYAGYQDYKNGTSRNVVETTVSVAGGWAGGFGGAAGGVAIGSAICPGIGTIIGGIIGGVTGGITGSVGSGIVADKIGDAFEYNIEEIRCERCGEKFKARKYKAQKCCERCFEQLNNTENNLVARSE